MKPTQATTTPAKKEAYMSMDRDERDILRTLGLRERALYPELKWLASFKTGEVQHFGKRVITFQFLADLITVPTTQGRAADTMNAKEACRVLMKLHDAGLVGEIENHPTKGLRFALPMSPICKKTAHKLRHEAKGWRHFKHARNRSAGEFHGEWQYRFSDERSQWWRNFQWVSG